MNTKIKNINFFDKFSLIFVIAKNNILCYNTYSVKDITICYF